MREFFSSTEAGAGETGRNQALEIVEKNIDWTKNNKNDFEANFVFQPKLF